MPWDDSSFSIRRSILSSLAWISSSLAEDWKNTRIDKTPQNNLVEVVMLGTVSDFCSWKLFKYLGKRNRFALHLIPSICEVHSALKDNASISLPIKLLPQGEIKVSNFSMVTLLFYWETFHERLDCIFTFYSYCWVQFDICEQGWNKLRLVLFEK